MKDSLRISVTQKCNLSCLYCHKEGQINANKEMTLGEIKEISNAAKTAGIKKIKITGGEPLLRKDIVDIVGVFKDFEDVSIVTNGVLLKYLAKPLKDAGLKRVNIGCDSITSSSLKNKKTIIDGLKAAKTAGLFPIKINMVVLKGINDHEINDMIIFARENKAVLQLIELINTNNEFYKKHYYSLEEFEAKLDNHALLITKRELHNRRWYNLGDVVVEVVRPFHNQFCSNCKRIRITSDGRIKTCLLRNDNLAEFEGSDSLIKAMGEIAYDRCD